MLRKWSKFPVSIPLSHWCIISHFTASEMIPTDTAQIYFPVPQHLYVFTNLISPKALNKLSQFLVKFGATILPAQVPWGVQAEENILTRCLKTRCTDLILVFWYRGYARNISALGYVSTWDKTTICEAVTSARASLCQVGQKFGAWFFTEITSFYSTWECPICWPGAVSSRSTVPWRAPLAQEQDGRVGVALRVSPHLHMCFWKRTVPGLSLPSNYLSTPYFCKAHFLLFVNILEVSEISLSISHEIKLCLCISLGCRWVA